jgi:hypothetical protein
VVLEGDRLAATTSLTIQSSDLLLLALEIDVDFNVRPNGCRRTL